MKKETVYHTFPPYYQEDSRILILGTMPSRKSRELEFYYMHPQNRFWKVLSSVFEDSFPDTLEDKKLFLKRHKIALWDCIESCTISLSSDASIRDVVPVDLLFLLKRVKVEKIYTLGNKASELYQKYLFPKVGILNCSLPSTSSANARYSLEDLIQSFQVLKDK